MDWSQQDMNFMFEWEQEHKIHIFKLTCNVLFVIWTTWININQININPNNHYNPVTYYQNPLFEV